LHFPQGKPFGFTGFTKNVTEFVYHNEKVTDKDSNQLCLRLAQAAGVSD
jgi:hypothetical protein